MHALLSGRPGVVPALMSVSLATATAVAHAAAPVTDAKQLVEQVQQNESPLDESVRMAMVLQDAAGKRSERTATYSQIQREPGSTRSMKLIRFNSPPELAGSGVLTHENAGRPDDQWLYMPAYHTSRRIPSSSRSDRYMGTDFFYEDVSRDGVELFRFEVVGEEGIEGRRNVVIDQVPTDEVVRKESAYGHKKQWIDPEYMLTSRVEYFDHEGRKIKRFDAEGAEQINGRWRWRAGKMTDLLSGHTTSISYSDRKIDSGLQSSAFTVRSLERPR